MAYNNNTTGSVGDARDEVEETMVMMHLDYGSTTESENQPLRLNGNNNKHWSARQSSQSNASTNNNNSIRRPPTNTLRGKLWAANDWLASHPRVWSRIDFDKRANLYSLMTIAVMSCVAVGFCFLIPYALPENPLSGAANMSKADWANFLICFIPIVTLELLMGVPPVRKQMYEWATRLSDLDFLYRNGLADSFYFLKFIPITLVFMFSFTITGLIQLIIDLANKVDMKQMPIDRYFSPLSIVFAFFFFLSAFGLLDKTTTPLFTPAELMLWLFMYVSLDLRWVYFGFYFGGDLNYGYELWAIIYTVVILFGWLVVRREPLSKPHLQFRLSLSFRDVLAIFLAICFLLAVVAPIGLGIRFLHVPPTHPHEPQIIFGNLVRIFTCVAVPEELFFRGLLFSTFTQKFGGRRWVGLILASLCFGLMHWPREVAVVPKISYVALATFAGAIFNSVYIISGNNIFASALVHTTTDTLWYHAFS